MDKRYMALATSMLVLKLLDRQSMYGYQIIRELERDLGCPIFDRTSRGMVPTRRGEEFLRYAKAILAHVPAAGGQRQDPQILCRHSPRPETVS